jgi:hypothetical protein
LSAGHDAVRDFLHALVEPQDALLPRFVAAGVESAASLRVLAALPEDEQLKFLRADLRLGVLQSRVVRHGLTRLLDA